MSDDPERTAGHLGDFQAEVSRAFFSLPASRGFRLAGGAALLALRLSNRATRDLDLFTTEGLVEPARQALVEEAERRGWTAVAIRTSPTFCQLTVARPDGSEVLIDLAVDGPPLRPAVATGVGMTYDPEEIAGQKTLALFNRAAERDFVDIRTLARRFGTELLLDRAGEIDAGFDVTVFAEMTDMLDRFTDAELPTTDPTELRTFFRDWAADLRGR